MHKVAALSVDVDSVATHLEGYGFERPPEEGHAYRLAIPRILGLLDRLQAGCTFFLIAEEAARYPEVVLEIVQRGHEVASHSLTHPVPFEAIDVEALRREVGDSKEILESLTQRSILGFRAPSFALDERLLTELVRAGYVYDASAYPTPAAFVMRRAIAARRGRLMKTAGPRWRDVLGPTYVHARLTREGPITEVPVSTTPVLRLPYYHTPRFLLPPMVFSAIDLAIRIRRRNVSYSFHAVDFMDVAQDGLDERISRHPGMGWALQDKLNIAQRAVMALSRRGPVVTISELIRREAPELLPLTGV